MFSFESAGYGIWDRETPFFSSPRRPSVLCWKVAVEGCSQPPLFVPFCTGHMIGGVKLLNDRERMGTGGLVRERERGYDTSSKARSARFRYTVGGYLERWVGPNSLPMLEHRDFCSQDGWTERWDMCLDTGGLWGKFSAKVLGWCGWLCVALRSFGGVVMSGGSLWWYSCRGVGSLRARWLLRQLGITWFFSCTWPARKRNRYLWQSRSVLAICKTGFYVSISFTSN